MIAFLEAEIETGCVSIEVHVRPWWGEPVEAHDTADGQPIPLVLLPVTQERINAFATETYAERA